MRALHLIVTGGSGYIGQRFVELACGQGHQITLLSSGSTTVQEDHALRRFNWTLGAPVPGAAFSFENGFGPAHALIHLGHIWQSGLAEGEDENVAGSDILFKAARAAGVTRIVFGSSVAAREGALNRYGRVKWRAEGLLVGAEEIAARIGLVYGGPSSGQWGTLCTMVRAAPILPIPASGTLVQPVHRDDVCAGLLTLAEAGSLKKTVYGLAATAPLPLSAFLKRVGRVLYGRRVIIFPIPVQLALLGAAMTGFVPFLPTLDRERVLGLAGITTIETAEDLLDLGLSLRSFEAGLAGEASIQRGSA